MATGNLQGSNLFDMLELAVDDILYLKGPILAHVSTGHGVSAMSAVVMTGIAIIGFFYRPKKRVFRVVGWVSLGLFVMYLLNSYVLYLYV
jgi:cation:H+ antiporter